MIINNIFKGFYTNLYKTETDFDETVCKEYLDKLELPRITQMDKDSLEAPLSLEELHEALKSLQGPVAPAGRTPGRKASLDIKCTLSRFLYNLYPLHHLGVVLRLTLNLTPSQR